jgi:hypothetical protein
MKTLIQKAGWLVCVGLALMPGTGCKTIVRENIISAIDTGVGATIAENKQTQLYELKAGYIRSQFYSIPTGKIVENSSTNNAMISGTNGTPVNAQISNAANVTPQLVAGIKSHTGLGDILLGMDVSENFAVGDIAVMSPAATAMYIANAENSASAKAASEAVQGKDTADKIAAILNKPDHQKDVSDLNELVKKPLTKKVTANNKDFAVGTSAGDYADALAAEKNDTLGNIRVKPSRADDLKEIVGKLTDATK